MGLETVAQNYNTDNNNHSHSVSLDHTHTVTIPEKSIKTSDNEPPYYNVAFLIKIK